MESSDEIERPRHGVNDGKRIDEMEMIGGDDERTALGDILFALDAHAGQHGEETSDDATKNSAGSHMTWLPG